MKRRLSSIMRFIRRVPSMLAAMGLVGNLLVGAMIALPALTVATPAQAACTASGPFFMTLAVTTQGDLNDEYGGPASGPTLTCSGYSQTATICANWGSGGTLKATRTTAPNNTIIFGLLGTGSSYILTSMGIIQVSVNPASPPSASVQTQASVYHYFAAPYTMNTLPGSYVATGLVTFSGHAVSAGECTGTTIAGLNGSTTWTATITIAPICFINTVGAMAFGSFSEVGTTSVPHDASAVINFQCNTTTPYTLTLGDGANRATPGVGSRQMANGASRLPYDIYTDSGRSTPYPEGTGLSGSGNGTTAIAQTLYGRIPVGTVLPPVGNYSDAVLVTLTY